MTHPQDAKPGQALYTRPFLAVYDRLVLGAYCRFFWRCPAQHLLELYNQHVSANHLDIGVGTGYFLDRCTFPVRREPCRTVRPRLALLDLNRNSLHKSARRLRRYEPEVYHWNVLELDQLHAPPFDSVGLANLLHCLPGTMQTKRAVFEHARAMLNPGGVVFGATMLYQGVELRWWMRRHLDLNNALGTMCNKQDDLAGLERNLEEVFATSSIRVVGSEALFWGRV
jgi:hypothetical protein